MKREEELNKPYRTFEDLEVYQVARDFRKVMYRVARKLPNIEKFELAPQICDAAISLPSWPVTARRGIIRRLISPRRKRLVHGAGSFLVAALSEPRLWL